MRGDSKFVIANEDDMLLETWKQQDFQVPVAKTMSSNQNNNFPHTMKQVEESVRKSRKDLHTIKQTYTAQNVKNDSEEEDDIDFNS
jgi:hypothetical protein